MDTQRAKGLAAIKKKISKVDPAFASAIKNLEPCSFGVVKPKVSQYQSPLKELANFLVIALGLHHGHIEQVL